MVCLCINRCSYAYLYPSNISEVDIIATPKTCSPKLLPPLELEFTKLLRPIVMSPTTASKHPIICLFYMTMLSKIFENMRVVMMLPPCSNLKVDPEMKLKAKYCMTDNITSQNPGTKK